MGTKTIFCCFVFLLYFSFSYGTVKFYNQLSASATHVDQDEVDDDDVSYNFLSSSVDTDPNSCAITSSLTNGHPCAERLTFDEFKFRFDWPEYAIAGIWANPSYAVFSLSSATYQRVVEARLVKNGNTFSSDRSSPTQYFTNSLPAPLYYGSSSDLWGLTLAQSDVTRDNFGISLRACKSSGADKSNACFGVRLNVTYSLSVQLTSVTPNSVTTTWATFSSFSVTIGGSTFRNITENNVNCKFGSVSSVGFFMDTTHIGCYVPAQTLYGPQTVAISLDNGATWTNDPVTFTYNCNAAVLCNNHGTCSNNGACNCSPGWSGPDCNTPLCRNGVVNPGEACDDGDNVDTNGCSNACTITPGWTCSGTAPSYCKKCGNNIVESNAGEACDDGALTNGDGCSSTCTIESGWTCANSPSQCQKCGDGKIQFTETCDDNNTIAGDGCSNLCAVEIGWNCTGVPSKCSLCGNSIVENGETCDDGNTNSGDGCTNKCIKESGYACPPSGGICSPVCGDGIKTPNEKCDDGNLVNGDGCAKNCTLEIGYNCTIPAFAKTNCTAVCGNSIITPTEACDDGNKNSTDGCSSSCVIEPGYSCSGQPSVCVTGCGDGIKTSGEECDDGGLSVGDGCSSGCKIEYGWACNVTGSISMCYQVCGNGIVTKNETCDVGSTPSAGCVGCKITNGWTCSGEPSVCQFCGNGIVEGNEPCDDGGYVNGDGCNGTCNVEQNYVCFVNVTSKKSICSQCGDGILSGLEQCDDGDRTNGDGCSSSCVVETGYTCTTASPSVCGGACGNGIITAGESCDDNNTNPDDGCNACKITLGYSCSGQPSVCSGRCGNFYVTSLTGEHCDDGNLVNGDGCTNLCAVEPGWNCTGITSVCTPFCGDTERLGNEECDDGGSEDGDGCSSTCQIETGWSCSGTPSACSTICGDGFIRGNEMCDPGAIPIDGCDSGCGSITPGFVCEGEPSNCTGICGDGIIVGAETCDDKNSKSGDGCNTACQRERGYVCSGAPSVCLALCGDGIIAGLETCDDNNTFNGDGCSSTCSVEYGWICTGLTCSPICGNGFLNGKELCDDNNLDDNDGCSSNCTIELGFYCSGTPSSCITQCSDGYTRGKEECDDGNLIDGDGCNHYCEIELGYGCEGDPSTCNPICGDGIRVKVEQCDMDNGTYPLGERGCSENCTIVDGWSCSTVGNYSNCIEICGNGIVTESEQCDDGNTAAFDGCFQCKTEEGWSCNGKVMSVCTQAIVFINPGTNKSTLGMAIAFPIAGFFIIAALLAYLLIKRRNKYKKLVKPDFAAIAFDDKTFGASSEDISSKKREVLESLEKLLTQDDEQYWLALTLCNLTAVTELDKLTKALTFIFYHHNKAVDLVKLAVKEEVKKSESENTLFRGNSYASKMFTSYSRITGLEYLWYTLGLMICEVNELGKPREADLPATDSNQSIRHTSSLINISLELDPRKMDDNADIMSNQIQIQLFVHKLWKTIADSEKKIPTDFRQIFSTISEEVNKKFGDKIAVYKGVGGFFFLRFVCPSITSPHIYGLLPEPLYEASQRYAILLSKVLQNISNGTMPGNKEEYMAFLNKFIEQHIPQAMSFFDKIVVPEGHSIGVEQYPVPQNHRDNSLVWIQKHLKVIQSKLQVEMSDSAKSEEFRQAIQAIMDYE